MKSFQSGPGTMQRKLSGSGFGRREGENGECIFLESAEAGVRFAYAVEKEAKGEGERRCRPIFDVEAERGLAFDHIEAVRMGLERL